MTEAQYRELETLRQDVTKLISKLKQEIPSRENALKINNLQLTEFEISFTLLKAKVDDIEKLGGNKQAILEFRNQIDKLIKSIK